MHTRTDLTHKPHHVKVFFVLQPPLLRAYPTPVSLGSAASAQYWWRFPGYDCPSMDISNDKNTSLQALEDECSKTTVRC